MIMMRNRVNRSGIERRLDTAGSRVNEEHCDEDNQSKNSSYWQSQSWLSLILTRSFNVVKWALLIIIIPPFLNFAALQKESAELIPTAGQLYDIGGSQKLYMSCMGKGKPTVILDAPTGQSSDVWLSVQEHVAELTRVCVYDRAGLGFSDRSRTTKLNSTSAHHRGEESTVERMTEDLRALLTVSSQSRPFVLVGAELGGLVARFYSHLYEGEVTDLVLVDPLVENLLTFDDGLWSHYWFSHLLPNLQWMQLTAAVGITRLGLLSHFIQPHLHTSENVTRRQKYLLCHPRHLSSAVDEHFFINESLSQIRTLRMMKPYPNNFSVTVLNGNYYDEQMPSPLNKAWAKSQQYLLTDLHPNAKHIVVNGADHTMVYKMPRVLAETVMRIVKTTRQKMRKVLQFSE